MTAELSRRGSWPEGVEPLRSWLADLYAGEALAVAAEFCVGQAEHDAVACEVDAFGEALSELVRRSTEPPTESNERPVQEP